MKKKLFLRLCLTMTVLFICSCRQDVLQEKEVYNNSGAFQLKSKRISLNESKHKVKLLPELEKVEAELKTFSKTNAQGKVVSYANGVSIDTDNVTYIENGSNYHTYTFNLTRDNALPTDPVENLVLTPLADGSYKELLITYNLTPQEKQALMIGASVDTKGKTTVTELAKGSYNSGGQLARFNCGYQSTTIWVNCCHNGFHNPTNVDDWASCVCPPEGQPNVYTVVSYVCAPVYDTITPTDPGGSSGGDGGGGGNPPCTDCPPEPETPTEPCNGNGVLTGPFDPVLSPGDGGCGGVVTLPTLPTRNNPCEKTKAMLENPEVKKKLDSLKKKSTEGGEIGFKIKKDGTTSDIIEGGEHEVDLGDRTGWQGGYHNHTPDGIPMHSPPDIDDGLLRFARAQPAGEHNNAYFGMLVKKVCSTCPGGFKIYHYVIRFNGTYADATTSFSNEDQKGLREKYKETNSDLVEPLLNGNNYRNSEGKLNEIGLEKLFFDTLANMGLSGKVILQRIENGIVNTIIKNNDGTTTAVPCP